MKLKEKDVGMFARLPLCPKCGDTKSVKESSRRTTLIGTFIEYGCKECSITWEGLANDRAITS